MRCLILILLLCSCAPSDPLHPLPPCGQMCAVDGDGSLVLGMPARAVSCNTGTSVCDYSGDGPPMITCPDFLPVSPEVCDPNGVDENCDGEVNNLLYQWYDANNTCSDVGECKFTAQYCDESGHMVCFPTSPYYGVEICDSWDNDCDGLTDSDDPDLVYGSDSFEYSGSPETLNVGECRAGSLRCENGIEYLFGEVLPTEEVCGNGDDDDCDGFTDEDESGGNADAFLISIDFSGSMSGTIETVIETLCTWANSQTLDNSRFAIQAVAANYNMAPYNVNVSDFTDAGTACSALYDFYMHGPSVGGLEYVAYGIWSINNTTEFHLDWPDNMRRRVIFFSDEGPQSYIGPNALEDLYMVAEDCSEHKYSVGGFVSSAYAQWHLITEPCAGWLEPLVDDPDLMREALNYRFGTECGEGNVSGGT